MFFQDKNFDFNHSLSDCGFKYKFVMMLKQFGRNGMRSGKKKPIGTSMMQDMNFLSLKEFYNSIPGMRICKFVYLNVVSYDESSL